MTTFLNFAQKMCRSASSYGQNNLKRNLLDTVKHPYKKLLRLLYNMRSEHYAAIGIVSLFVGQAASMSIYYLLFGIIGILCWCYVISYYFKQINPRYVENREYFCVIVLLLAILVTAFKLGYVIEKNAVSAISVPLLAISTVYCVRTFGVLKNVELEFDKIQERALVLASEGQKRIRAANGYYFGGIFPIADRIKEVIIADKNISWEKALDFVVSKMIEEESKFNHICEEAVRYYVGERNEKDFCVFEPVNNNERLKLADTIFNLYNRWAAPSASIYYHFREYEVGRSMAHEIFVDIRNLWFKSVDEAVVAILKFGLLREYAFRKKEYPTDFIKFNTQDLIDDIPENLMKRIKILF